MHTTWWVLLGTAGALGLACDRAVAPGSGAIVVQVLAPGASSSVAHGAATHSAAIASGATLDSARVTVTGPITKSVTGVTAAGGFFDVIVDQLPAGSYTVQIEGWIGGQVTAYGKTTGVGVSAGQTATATIQSFGAFAPVLQDFISPTTQFTLHAAYSAVTGATQYLVESDRSSSFPNPIKRLATDTAGIAAASDTGVTYVRVRAVNQLIAAGAGAPSAVKTFRVVKEPSDTSDLPAHAEALGFVPNITVTGVNIAPAGDVDWYSLSVCNGDSVRVDAKAVRLDPPSPLNVLLQFFDSTSTTTPIAISDDADSTDAAIRLKVPSSETYRIRVSASPEAMGIAAVGQYQLVVHATAGVHNSGSGCRIPAPPALPDH